MHDKGDSAKFDIHIFSKKVKIFINHKSWIYWYLTYNWKIFNIDWLGLMLVHYILFKKLKEL